MASYNSSQPAETADTYSAFDGILEVTVIGIAPPGEATSPLTVLLTLVAALLLSMAMAELLDRVRLRPAPERRES